MDVHQSTQPKRVHYVNMHNPQPLGTAVIFCNGLNNRLNDAIKSAEELSSRINNRLVICYHNSTPNDKIDILAAELRNLVIEQANVNVHAPISGFVKARVA